MGELSAKAIATQSKTENFFVRLVKGDISLPITFLVFGWLIGGIFSITLIVFQHQLSSSQLEKFYPIMLGYSIFCFIYYVTSSVAIWNSAGKYKGRRKWVILAKMAVIIGVLNTGLAIFDSFYPSEHTLFKELKRDIESYNRELPIMLNEDQRMDAVSLEGKDLIFNMQLVNEIVPERNISEFISIMEPELRKMSCEKKEMKEMLNIVKINYAYRDKNNNPVAKVVIQGSDCLK